MSNNASAGSKLVVEPSHPAGQLDEKMIKDVVHGFYDEIRRDDLLGPIFEGAIAADQWPVHLQKMCDFWSATLLRTSRYEGRPLPPHLAITGLDEMHFRRWLTLFRATVRRQCPPEIADRFMGFAYRIAHSFRMAIAFHLKKDTLGIDPILEANL